MKTVSVTIYCDEGSKGSNHALPQKKLPSWQLLLVIKSTVLLVFRGFDFYWEDAGDFYGVA